MIYWFVGFILVISYRAFDFTRQQELAKSGNRGYLDVFVFEYFIHTFLTAFVWPIAIPLYGIYKLGELYHNRKNKA